MAKRTQKTGHLSANSENRICDNEKRKACVGPKSPGGEVKESSEVEKDVGPHPGNPPAGQVGRKTKSQDGNYYGGKGHIQHFQRKLRGRNKGHSQWNKRYRIIAKGGDRNYKSARM